MAKPKFDYKSIEFLDKIEKLAKQGLTDGEIAFTIGLSYQRFSDKKNKIKEMSEALTRGRNTINAAIRQTYLSVALGKIKTKSTTKKIIDTENGISELVFETETEQPPNPQALATWLFNHDEEWRRLTIEGKKLDVTTNGKDLIPEIKIEIIDKREDIENPDNENIQKG